MNISDEQIEQFLGDSSMTIRFVTDIVNDYDFIIFKYNFLANIKMGITIFDLLNMIKDDDIRDAMLKYISMFLYSLSDEKITCDLHINQSQYDKMYMDLSLIANSIYLSKYKYFILFKIVRNKCNCGMINNERVLYQILNDDLNFKEGICQTYHEEFFYGFRDENMCKECRNFIVEQSNRTINLEYIKEFAKTMPFRDERKDDTSNVLNDLNLEGL